MSRHVLQLLPWHWVYAIAVRLDEDDDDADGGNLSVSNFSNLAANDSLMELLNISGLHRIEPVAEVQNADDAPQQVAAAVLGLFNATAAWLRPSRSIASFLDLEVVHTSWIGRLTRDNDLATNAALIGVGMGFGILLVLMCAFMYKPQESSDGRWVRSNSVMRGRASSVVSSQGEERNGVIGHRKSLAERAKRTASKMSRSQTQDGLQTPQSGASSPESRKSLVVQHHTHRKSSSRAAQSVTEPYQPA